MNVFRGTNEIPEKFKIPNKKIKNVELKAPPYFISKLAQETQDPRVVNKWPTTVKCMFVYYEDVEKEKGKGKEKEEVKKQEKPKGKETEEKKGQEKAKGKVK